MCPDCRRNEVESRRRLEQLKPYTPGGDKPQLTESDKDNIIEMQAQQLKKLREANEGLAVSVKELMDEVMRLSLSVNRLSIEKGRLVAQLTENTDKGHGSEVKEKFTTSLNPDQMATCLSRIIKAVYGEERKLIIGFDLDLLARDVEVICGTMQGIVDNEITQLTEQITIEELRKFHNKTLGLTSDNRWNTLRVLEKNAWAKYYLEMQGREIDIAQLKTSPACKCKNTAAYYDPSCDKREWLAGSNDPHFDGYNKAQFADIQVKIPDEIWLKAMKESEKEDENLPLPENDSVNHPSHYTSHPSGVECITIARHMTFNLGNVLKYIWRCEDKGKYLEDLKKAAWYLNNEIELELENIGGR